MGRKQRRLYGNRQRVTRAKGGVVCCEAAFSPEGFAQARVLSFRLRKGLGEVAWEGSDRIRTSIYREDAGHQAGIQEACGWSSCGLGRLGPQSAQWVSDSPDVPRNWAG